MDPSMSEEEELLDADKINKDSTLESPGRSGSPSSPVSGGSSAGSCRKLKKDRSQVKIEYMNKLFGQNEPGKSIHERMLLSPNPKVARKLKMENLKSR